VVIVRRHDYICIMPKKVITVDLNKWCTISDKAKADKVKLGTLSARIARSKKGNTPNPIEFWEIPELGITLVRK